MKLNSWLKRWPFRSYPQRRRVAYGLSLGCRRDVAEVLFVARAEQLETRTLLAAGALDTTFDGSSGNANGKFMTDIGTSTDQAFGMALDGTGRIVVGGYTRDIVGLDHDSSLARYSSSTGSLDATFDGPGGNGNGKFSAGVNGNLDQIRALAIDSSGRIVTAGYANDNGIHFSVQRFNANGTRDTSFSGNGVDLTPSFSTGSDDRAYAVAIDSSGKIIVAGSTLNGTNYDFAVARYNSNGTLDTSFSLHCAPLLDIANIFQVALVSSSSGAVSWDG